MGYLISRPWKQLFLTAYPVIGHKQETHWTVSGWLYWCGNKRRVINTVSVCCEHKCNNNKKRAELWRATCTVCRELIINDLLVLLLFICVCGFFFSSTFRQQEQGRQWRCFVSFVVAAKTQEALENLANTLKSLANVRRLKCFTNHCLIMCKPSAGPAHFHSFTWLLCSLSPACWT